MKMFVCLWTDIVNVIVSQQCRKSYRSVVEMKMNAEFMVPCNDEVMSTCESEHKHVEGCHSW